MHQDRLDALRSTHTDADQQLPIALLVGLPA
jgi:hypothetical protein